MSIETLSQLELFPKSILCLITDSLTYYECFNLGVTNRFWLDITLNLQSFWKRRHSMDFDPNFDKSITRSTDHKHNYRNSLINTKNLLYFLSDSSIPPSEYPFFYKDVNQILRCGIPRALSVIFTFVNAVIGSLIQPGIRARQRRQSFIESLTQIDDRLWKIPEAHEEEFTDKVIVQSALFNCSSTILFMVEKLNLVKFDVAMLLFVNAAGNYNTDTFKSLMNLSAQLMIGEIKDPMHFIEKEGVSNFSYLLSRFHRYMVNDIISKSTLDNILTFLFNMNPALSRAICRDFLICFDAHLVLLTWFLNHPLVPEQDMDVIATFGNKFSSDDPAEINQYKQLIRDYVRRYPSALSEQGYLKLMNV